VGVLNLDFFNIYNRFGQLLYTTSQIGQGWDGTYNGVAQPAGTYIYTVQGKNYLGKQLSAKGTVVLIR
jgi:gliding motility-associated-like protein